MSTTNTQSKAAFGAWQNAHEVFNTLNAATAKYIITSLLTHREQSLKQLTTDEFTYGMLTRYIRRLLALKVVRKIVFGREVTFKLNYDTLDIINGAAARLL